MIATLLFPKTAAGLGVFMSSALSLLLFTACASTTAGAVSGGRYTAPEELFSMPIPELSAGLVIEDNFQKSTDGRLRAGLVSFHDDFGHVRSVTYEEVPTEVRSRSDLRDFFNDVCLVTLREGWPGTTVDHQGPLTLRDGAAGWFAVLTIPEGSPMVTYSSEHPDGRRRDSTRGFFLVFHGDLLLTVSAADDSVFGGVVREASTGDSDVARLKQTVTDVYASMSFDQE